MQLPTSKTRVITTLFRPYAFRESTLPYYSVHCSFSLRLRCAALLPCHAQPKVPPVPCQSLSARRSNVLTVLCWSHKQKTIPLQFLLAHACIHTRKDKTRQDSRPIRRQLCPFIRMPDCLRSAQYGRCTKSSLIPIFNHPAHLSGFYHVLVLVLPA